MKVTTTAVAYEMIEPKLKFVTITLTAEGAADLIGLIGNLPGPKYCRDNGVERFQELRALYEPLHEALRREMPSSDVYNMSRRLTRADLSHETPAEDRFRFAPR